jgi:glycyl-tRNA synthetase alpha chain
VNDYKELSWNGADDYKKLTYADVDLEAEKQFCEYNFKEANTEILFRQFAEAEIQCNELIEKNLPIPAYDFCIQASHLFNLLNARNVISSTERASYIARIRNLAKVCCVSWMKMQGDKE